MLLDTSAYSAFLRGHPGIRDQVERADALHLNPVVLGELLAGFRKGSRFDRNLGLLRQFLDSPRAGWIGIDDETADRYSLIQDQLRRQGTPIPSNDLWIAATAMQHGLRLLTTDPHFERVPQIRVDLYPL